MGCDYYIVKLLHVYYNDSNYLEVELQRTRGYYVEDPEDLDEDEEDSDERMNNYVSYTLTPKMKPIMIYNNGFSKPHFESKYKSLVENILITTYNRTWSEITKIIKVEERQ